MILRLALLSLLLLPSLIAGTNCPGYDNCPVGSEGKLNVHLVPHTHNDVGWLKTLDQYYYGANTTIQPAGVQYILDAVIVELLKKPDRRFIYVEMAFFTRWWNEQDADMQDQVKKLVDEGRLEFILGGWCMNDEASTHYTAIIDQMTLGLEFIQKTFGSCARPKVAWQIDPFGHSREQASLFAQMGFDGLFFGRLDYQDKEKREKERNMEEIWRGSASLNPPFADLFTGVNENGYNPPAGFCFDQYCADSPVMDNHMLEDYNVDEKVDLFVKRATNQAQHYATNHIMWTMGSDFQYSNANMWYKNLDKVIKYVNAANRNISVFYSTPSCYLNALNKADKRWNVKHDDFFPYAEQPHSFWTGYFTSRPALKGYTRESSSLLQACTQLETIMTSHNSNHTSWKLRRAMGVAQHHDAVSGTSKQHVADDYAKRLYIGREECKQLISDVLMVENLVFCDYLNISSCSFTQHNDNFLVVLYNPIARHVINYVTIPVTSSVRSYQVRNKLSSSVINNQVMTSSDSLVFAADIQPMSTAVYEVVLTKSSDRKMASDVTEEKEELSISNEFYKVDFDSSTGLMSKVRNLEKGMSVDITQNFYWYNSSMGDEKSWQQSGAYVFRPNSSTPFHCSHGSSSGKTKAVRTSSGELVQEVTQYMGDWCRQVVRLYRGKRYIEVKWTIGPIPIDEGLGKEVITRYETSIASNQLFYTDSNGREIIQRKLNYRPTWSLNQSEPVAGNYYPINTRAYIKDQSQQLTILTDRTQGGASLKDGSIEIMLHRRVLGEDQKGVGESLNETTSDGKGMVVTGKHYLIFDTPQHSPSLHRILAEEIFLAPVIAFAKVDDIPKHVELVKEALPQNVHVVTLARREDGSVLLRLEHQFEKDEDQLLSKPVTINLHNVVPDLNFKSVREMVLGANAEVGDITRLVWKSNDQGKIHMKRRRSKRDLSSFGRFSNTVVFEKSKNDDIKTTRNLEVTLEPMQIRTFILE